MPTMAAVGRAHCRNTGPHSGNRPRLAKCSFLYLLHVDSGRHRSQAARSPCRGRPGPCCYRQPEACAQGSEGLGRSCGSGGFVGDWRATAVGTAKHGQGSRLLGAPRGRAARVRCGCASGGMGGGEVGDECHRGRGGWPVLLARASGAALLVMLTGAGAALAPVGRPGCGASEARAGEALPAASAAAPSAPNPTLGATAGGLLATGPPSSLSSSAAPPAATASKLLPSSSFQLFGSAASPSGGDAGPASATANAAASSMSVSRRQKRSTFIKEAVEKVGPAVVRLDSLNDGQHDMSLEDGYRLHQFFTEDIPLQIPGVRSLPKQTHGSGFIVDKKGVIVTNAHVVGDATKVKVRLAGGQVLQGTVCGKDELRDLAVVKIVGAETSPPLDLVEAPLGDSASLETGDFVIAMGNPLGLNNTITLGVISNLHRSAAEIGLHAQRGEYIQMDCAINPGNSGGPLVNEFGEVIGISAAIRADAEGIGFGIPINAAKGIVRTLADGGIVKHGYLGIKMITLSPSTYADCRFVQQ
mmetsp:Transcript_9604/g.35199  ORF Transcript_9604/g.35199 Transcript_9604/m.35199 type:complete len:528 (+) Transcript_9604:125-1708(+)